MNETVTFLFSLAGAVLSQKPVPPMPESVNWEEIFAISEKHNIASVIAYGIRQGNYEVDSSVRERFKQYLYTHLIITENQTREIDKIFEKFEENQIDYLPFKGIEIRHMYPSPDMRRMGDGDILVKKKDYLRFDSIMKQLGYTFKVESNHEYVYQKPPFLQIELHKMLIPSYNDDMYAYYQDGWSIAKKNEGTYRYSLSKEDHYVYLMTHVAKHYRDGGVGIKSIMDLFLYQRTYEMDEEYIDRQLLQLHLRPFSNNIDDLIKVWFEGAPSTELIDSMTRFILRGGEYGSLENKAQVAAIRDTENGNFEKTEKWKYIKIIFPKYEELKGPYSYLRNKPFLLPVCWVHRWIKGLFFTRNINRVKRQAGSITAQGLQEYSAHMMNVGLDIYNGRKHS